MNTLIASIGDSPAIVTEAIDEFGRSGIGINKVVLLYTKDMHRYFTMLKIDFKLGVYEDRIKPIGIKLPMNDIKSKEDIAEFRHIMYNVVNNERKSSDVYLLVSGGRKSMVVDSTLVALANGLDAIYHVLLPAASGVLKSEPSLLYNIEQYENEIPDELLEKIIEICHPRLSGNLIKIPLPILDERCKDNIINMINYL